MDDKVLGYQNHKTACLALYLSNERSAYDAVRSNRIESYGELVRVLGFSMGSEVPREGFTFRHPEINREEIMEHVRSIRSNVD